MLIRVLVLAGVLGSTAAWAQEVYRWVDGQGEVHYTDDLQTVPEAYRKKATPVDGGNVTTLPRAPQPPQYESSEPPLPAGAKTEEERWREEFTTVRQRIAFLEKQLAEDKKLLEGSELAPRVNNMGGMTINPKAVELTQRVKDNEAELVRRRAQLKDLERRATHEAVPLEWRR